jgi:hypothetical protein
VVIWLEVSRFEPQSVVVAEGFAANDPETTIAPIVAVMVQEPPVSTSWGTKALTENPPSAASHDAEVTNGITAAGAGGTGGAEVGGGGAGAVAVGVGVGFVVGFVVGDVVGVLVGVPVGTAMTVAVGVGLAVGEFVGLATGVAGRPKPVNTSTPNTMAATASTATITQTHQRRRRSAGIGVLRLSDVRRARPRRRCTSHCSRAYGCMRQRACTGRGELMNWPLFWGAPTYCGRRMLEC